MPRIPEYTAPATKLRGSEQGVNAWETAGRRLGGQYREAAATLAKAAAVRGQTLADKNQWPFNLFALKQKILASQEEAREAAAGPDVAFKVSNSGSFRRDGYTGNAGFQHPNTVSMAPGFTTPVNPNSVGGGYREYSGGTSQNYYNNSLAAQANDLVSRIGDTISPSSRSASSTGGNYGSPYPTTGEVVIGGSPQEYPISGAPLVPTTPRAAPTTIGASSAGSEQVITFSPGGSVTTSPTGYNLLPAGADT